MIDHDMTWEELRKKRTLDTSDSIFKKQANWTMNACLNYTSNMTGTYTSGFKALAQMGIEAVESSRSDLDSLVYPIVFCFRHHLELQLKQMIAHGFEFLERRQQVPNIHEIDKLWFELRGILKGIKKETEEYSNPGELKSAERVILELASLDPEGVSFRYARTRDGDSSIRKDLRILNLQSFSEAIEKLSFFLDGVGCHLHHLVDYKREADAEMRQNFTN